MVLAPSLLSRYHFTQQVRVTPLLHVRCSALSSVALHKKSGVDSVAIVGGGLGGLATAIALTKRGIDVQVYEKNAGISGGEGTMISLFPNGIWALMDAEPSLLEELKDGGVTEPTCLNYMQDGTLLGAWDLATKMEANYKVPMVNIRWRRVLDVFIKYLPPNCFHGDHALVDLQQEGDEVTAVFETSSGKKEVKAQVLVGADGIRSKVRDTIFTPMEPRDNGRCIWRAIIPFDSVSHPDLKPRQVVATVGKGQSAIIADAGQNCLYWSYTVTDDIRGDLANVRSKDGAEAKQRLQADFEGWGLPTQVLEATQPEAILERRVLDMPVLDEWVKGRVVLIGDAAHAVTPQLGQGANLAFEDSQELARQLSTASDVETALQEFQKIRIPRAKAIADWNTYLTQATYTEPGEAPAARSRELNRDDFMYGYRSPGVFAGAA